jgi:hypothetical protein
MRTIFTLTYFTEYFRGCFSQSALRRFINAKSSALLAEFQHAAKMKGSVTKFMTCSAAILKVSGLFNVRI